jgi:diguanylate cyclase (GGDEF)-like protein/PAS domain S-box-containing protein
VRAAAEMERSLAINETLLEKDRAQITLHSIGDGVITTDNSGVIDYMNPVAEHLTGWRFHQVMGMSLESILHLEDEASGNIIPDPAQRCLSERRIISPKTENVLVSRNGTRYSIQGTAAPMFGSQGNCLGVVLVFKDVTVSRRHQKMIVHQATHDSLTGLVNRAEFEVRLQKAMESAKQFSNAHALLYLDLDQFKIVNDSAGHVAGDELLKQISALLSSQLRGRDTLGRLGGDEFSVLLENCPLSKASRVAEILIDSIRDYRFTWEDKTCKLGVSIGIVAITSESEEIMDLMKKADQACYAAKDLGRGCAYVATDNAEIPNVPPAEKLKREDMAYAIENGRFQLFYQPIVELNSEARSGLIRAEVLLRMIDLEGNDVKSGAFIPSAGRYGMMAQIDRWVISRLFNDYAHIFMQNPDLIMNVNLSAQAIADDMIIEFVLDQFHKNALSPKQICFEIGETTLTNHYARTSRFIGEMSQIGCSIALDDFGNGLSSFSYLKDTKVDFVKIDGALIRDVGMDIIDKAMVDSINTMCHLLGIRTIAKNTDSDLVVNTIKQLGIDYAQGYYLGNPVSMDEFTHLQSEEIRLSRAMIN